MFTGKLEKECGDSSSAFMILPGLLLSVGGINGNEIGSAFLRMFPAWISLAGAIILLVLASKHMRGGKLASPFILIGLGILIDALIQIITSFSSADIITVPVYYPEIVFTVSLLFRLSVVLGAIWIAGIFGVLRSSKKKSSLPPSSPSNLKQ